VKPTADVWEVHWESVSGSESVSTSSWIGLYDCASPNNAYHAFQYVNLESKKCVFKAPRKNGQYEARFFVSRFAMMSKSAPLDVHMDDAVHVSVHERKTIVDTVVASAVPSTCWVGLFHFNEHNPSRYRRYCWVSSATQRFEFKTPIHAGTYHARLYSDRNVLMAQSEIFIV